MTRAAPYGRTIRTLARATLLLYRWRGIKD